MIYNKKVDQYTLVRELKEQKKKLSMEYNMFQRFTFYDFINYRFIYKFDTFITFENNYLIIKFYQKNTNIFVNLMILTSSLYEDELQLIF